MENVSLGSNEIFSILSSEFKFENASFSKISSDPEKNIFVFINANITFAYIYSNLSQNFIYSSKSSVSITQTHLNVEMILGNFSSIISSNNNILEIYASSFLGFQNSEGATIKNYKTSLVVEFCIFQDNIAYDGGAIYTEDSNVNFQNNIFYSNRAHYGAAIFFQSNQIALDLRLINNCFHQGIAIYGGGGFFTVYEIPFLINNTFLNNSAKYGIDFASPPFRLSVDLDNSTQYSNYQPSSILIPPIVIQVIDIYRNIIKSTYKGKAILSLADEKVYQYFNFIDESINKKLIFGQLLSDLDEDAFQFLNVRINCKQNSMILLSITTDLIENFVEKITKFEFPNFQDSNGNYYFLLLINSSSCPIGD